jgi:hypothetical protein
MELHACRFGAEASLVLVMSILSLILTQYSLPFIHSTQAHIGSLAASPRRVTCSVRSMLSALDCKPTSGHLLCSVYAFGTRLQAHIGSLALFDLSMLSALDCKPAVCHLL